MINKKVIIGVCIGLLTTFIGTLIYTFYIGLKLDLDTNEIIEKLTSFAVIKKRASIGVFLNLPIVFLFLNRKKEEYAKGVIITIIMIAIIFMINKI